MAKYVIDETTLKNIANAIRDMNGETKPYTPDEMTQAIDTIYPSDNIIKNSVDEYFVDHPIDATTLGKVCPSFTESGIAVKCSPLEGYPLSVVSRIEPVQEGSGDPCPPGEGRNLWQVDTNTIRGYITTTGIEAYSGSAYTVYIPCEPNTTYTVSKAKGKRFSVAYCTALPAAGVPVYGFVTDGTAASITITTGDDAKYLVAYVYFGETDESTMTWDAAKHIVQIEKGNVATEYQPYTNIRPITGHTDVKLYHSGKNLFNIDKALNNVLTKEGENYKCGYFPGVGRQSKYVNLFAPAGATIRLSAEILEDTTTTGYPISMQLYYEDGYTGEIIDLVYAKTLSKNHGNLKMARIICNIEESGNAAYVVFRNLQVEIGSTATPFEPYNEGSNTFNLDLGQTVYGGSLDWKTGVLTVDRATIIVDGTESWTQNSVYTGDKGLRYDCDIATTLLFKEVEFMSSHYPYVSPNQGRGMWMYPKSGRVGLRIIGTYETADELKAYLAEQYAAGTPVQICCPLVTPVTVQLTPTEVLALSGTNTLISDCGETTVSGRSDPIALIENLTNAVIALGGTV